VLALQSFDGIFTWVVLGLIVLAVVALYGWLFWTKTRALMAAMIRLRDRIDRSKRW
jgi:type VI protein secretion system component VasF